MLDQRINAKEETISTPEVGKVDLWVKVAYGTGHIANYIKAILFGIFSLYFYTMVRGLSGKLVGLAMAIGLVWDAVIDPVIGTMSDNTRGRLGKRHGFMLFGTAGMGISLWAYFSPPANLCTGALFAWLLVISLLLRTMTSIYCIPYYALGAELSQDYHERTSITGIRGAFGLMGAMTTAVLSFILFFPNVTPGIDPKLNPAGYQALGLFAGLIMTLVGFVSTLGTWSHRQYCSNNKEKALGGSLRHFFANSLKALENSSFRAIFVSYSIFFLGTVINATIGIHFLTFYVRITASEALSAFHLAFYVGALIGIVVWMKIAMIIDKRWLYLIGTFATALIMCCAFWFLGEGHLFGTGNLPPLILGHGLAGFFASILWFVPASMIADVADEDELISFERREGVFFGLFNFGEQLAAGASLLLTGVLIDWFAGLIPGQIQQSATTVSRIGMLYSLLPSALLAMAAVLILRYSLNQRKVASIQVELAKRQTAEDKTEGSYHITPSRSALDTVS